MALNQELLGKVVAEILKEGEPDDLAKFVLSGNEPLAAVQQYFYNLEAKEKTQLYFNDDTWFVDSIKYCHITHCSNFFASSIIPFVEEIFIFNTHLKDYSFFNDIKHLKALYLKFNDQEYEKVLSALSSLKSVDHLILDFKYPNLQLLSSLTFSFPQLTARNFIFEVDPKCSKVFQTKVVELHGDEELKNDFVFTRQNYENYAALFPNATTLIFSFYIKIIDDISDLVKVSNPNHAAEVNIDDRNIEFYYDFFDYSGFPESKALEMIEDDEDWDTDGCPYVSAVNDMVENVTCSFPLAIEDVCKRIANNTVRRIPENRIGSPEDYYRLIIENCWEHKAEFEVLKTISVNHLFKAYRKITGIKSACFWFKVRGDWISNGTVADNFEDEDTIFFLFRDE